jgi:PAS domain S-box-containing protein
LKRQRFFLGILLLLICLAPAPPFLNMGFCQVRKHILVLHSYNKGLDWTDNEDKGIASILEPHSLDTEIYTEYLDTKRFPDARRYPSFFDFLKQKYASTAFDAVICSDDNAFDFLLKYHNPLFPGVPILFCGVNYFNDSLLKGNRDMITGVVESFDIPDTLRTALRLHPNTSRVVVINDRTTTGLANKKVLDEITPEFKSKVDFIFLEDLDMADLLKKVHTLRSGTIILLMSFNRDRSGQVFDYDQSIYLISRAASVPIYGVWDFYLGKGIVGGMLTSGRDQGRLAAQMALRIMDGVPVRDIPVVTRSPNRFMFDYRQLNRFGIHSADLPKGSMILNRPFSFYRIHPYLVWGTCAGFAGLIAIILLLLGLLRMRRRAEQTLMESEERFRALYESNPTMYLTVDEQGVIRSINRFGAQQLGYSEQELLGRPVADLSPQDDQKALQQNLADCMQHPDAVFRCELRKIHKDGHALWVRETARAVSRVEDRHLVVLIVSEDITERKSAEEELKRAHRRVVNTLESITDAFVAFDHHWRFTYINTEAERILGMRRQDLIGKNHWEVFPFTVGTVFDQIYHRVMETRKTADFEYHHQEKDRWHDNWRSYKTYPMEDGGVSVYFRDISDRKKAEKEYLQLAAAIEQLSESVLITDTNWIVRYVNPAFERMSGYEKKEIIGQHTRVLKNDKDTSVPYRKIRETLCGGEVWSGCITSQRKDGTTYDAEVTASPIRDNSGAIINYVTIRRDITQEVRLQKRLRQAQKMEAIGTLAGGIAHDFNNILSAIIGYTQMAQSKLPQESPVQYSLSAVLKAGSRATELVKQILAFSRQTDQVKVPVDVTLCVKETLKLLRPSLPTTIEISCEISVPHVRATVLADPTEIQQVLMNLCTNASHAMRPRGGVLSVKLSEVAADDLFLSRHPDLRMATYVCLAISDTGFGMDAALMERIFDPYFTTKGLGEGTGLGLAVALGIVKSYGGAITVDSELEKGSTFTIFLPRIEEKIAVQADIKETLPTGIEHILFVDDEKALTELGREMLESLGYTVTTKTSSIEALNAFRAIPSAFDLVITDMTMPGLTGSELAKELMAIKPDLPVILCTGFSELIDGNRAKDAGIREFVMKPYVVGDLAKTIRKALAEN